MVGSLKVIGSGLQLILFVNCITDKNVPDFELQTQDGKITTSEELKGKIVLLDFWNPHCGPCIKLMAHMEKLYSKYRDNPNILILVSVLFPPYAAGKLPVGENIHGCIGYHPIWNRPTVEYAYMVLHGEKYDPAAGVDLSGYFVMFNKVKFIFQLTVILLISSIMLIIFRKKRRTQ